MSANSAIEARFEAYSRWRTNLAEELQQLRSWLGEQGLTQGQIETHIGRMLNSLHDDRLYLAFVAEFSRGKSELINALFFGGSGQRLLPSSAGRTTMCPTELFHDADSPPSIRLLAIESRENGVPIAELKNFTEQWETLPLPLEDPAAIAAALRHVAETKPVSVARARALGFSVTKDISQNGISPNSDGEVDIPRWRYALINYPHPLLKDGLVILDTPGLNALGAEPELTLNTLPSAHAVLFVLAADTGVTQSEIAVWRQHVEGSHKGRLVVLNKVDGLWDDIKSEAEVQKEVGRQVEETARHLNVAANRVYPVSAQKALSGKIKGDTALVSRSGIELLEHALAGELLPSKGGIVAETVAAEFNEVDMSVRQLVDQRLQGLREHFDELNGLNGKNMDVIDHMMNKVRADKAEFDRSMQRFHATRNIFSQQSATLYDCLSIKQLDRSIAETKKSMERSLTTAGLKAAMQGFLAQTVSQIDAVTRHAQEIKTLMDGVYQKFQQEHGLANIRPSAFSVLRYTREIRRIEDKHEAFIGGLSLFMTEQHNVVKGFFESVISKVRAIYVSMNRDADDWLKDMMAPMESQVREHQAQLRRRLESVKRIHQASDTLEARMAELKQILEEITEQRQATHNRLARIRGKLNQVP